MAKWNIPAEAGHPAPVAGVAVRYVDVIGTQEHIRPLQDAFMASEAGRALYQQGDVRLVWANEGDLHAARIRSALAPAPQDTVALVERLVEALEAVVSVSDRATPEYDRARAALAAARAWKEGK